jgi:hypothetical protein
LNRRLCHWFDLHAVSRPAPITAVAADPGIRHIEACIRPTWLTGPMPAVRTRRR